MCIGDALTVTLAATGFLLIGRVRAAPVSVDCALSDLALESGAEIVEDCELVFAEHVGVGAGVEVVRNLGDSFLEVSGDTGVEVAFGVASYINGPLVGQLADAVNASLVVVGVGSAATHCRGRHGHGRAELKAFG